MNLIEELLLSPTDEVTAFVFVVVVCLFAACLVIVFGGGDGGNQ